MQSGLAAVDPKRRTAAAIHELALKDRCAILAFGKCAPGMARGAFEALGKRVMDGLVVGPSSAVDDQLPVPFLPGNHPVPGTDSVSAGQEIYRWLAELEPELPLLVLISGGGSAMVEIPVPGMSLAQLERLNVWLLSSGLDIRSINAVRARFSCLKRGGLLRLAGERPIVGLAISDVPDDRFDVIASGPLSPATEGWPSTRLPDWLQAMHENLPLPSTAIPLAFAETRIIARNSDVRDVVAACVRESGFEVCRHASLQGDAEQQGRHISHVLRDGERGVYLFGGETTVPLPCRPGRGGRNQHLALAAALELKGRDDILLLSLGTDGIDGNTSDAGAMVDGGTVQRVRDAGFDAAGCLRAADSNTALAAAGDVINTGPTGTNVSDVVIGWKFCTGIMPRHG